MIDLRKKVNLEKTPTGATVTVEEKTTFFPSVTITRTHKVNLEKKPKVNLTKPSASMPEDCPTYSRMTAEDIVNN